MSKSNTSAAQISKLANDLRAHKDSYYTGEATISDAEYDALENQLSELIAENPQYEDAAAVLSEVGAASDSTLFDSVRHESPMLSLNKVHDADALKAFTDGFPDQTFSLWPKFDGVSLSISYVDGKLVRAATRGDGTIGEDITQNVADIAGVPQKLPQSVTCEVRGEVVMRKSDFNAYNATTENKLANPRNGAAGTLRAKTREKVKGRKLTFFAFDLIQDSDESIADGLTALGFGAERAGTADSFDEIISFIDELAQSRDGLDYEIDGIVIKLADRKAYAASGNTSHHPRGAMAFKLAAEVGETTLVSVTWQVGKSGNVSPVAEIAPVFLAGTTISRASLHNMAIINERDIRAGDRIQIKRAGDVIPHVIGPIVDRRDGSEVVIAAPTNCPSCNSVLVESGESGIMRCENSIACSAQQIRRLIHWAGRSAADIDAIGESWIERLFDAGQIKQPSDFYTLTQADLLKQGEGMAAGRADKFLASIEKSKNLGLRRTLIGMSIPLASEGTAKRICRAGIASMEELRTMSAEALCEIEDIGPMVAGSLVAFLQGIGDEVEALRSAGVNLDVLPEDAPVVVSNSDGMFVGKKVCVTGSLSVGRKEFEALIEASGGKASGSVSKNTDYVVAGENAGSKLAKAEAAGVVVLTEEAARAGMNG